MNIKDNRRVVMTKKIIKDTFIEMLEKKNIQKIYVRELCEKADINRSTFYKYYESQYDLLAEMENDLLMEIEEKCMDKDDVKGLNNILCFLNDNKKLYLVATPIGNYLDMTYRAIEVLKKVDYIYCEDTRITGLLLSHFDIHTKMHSYNVVTENDLTDGLIKLIKEGNDVAVVSDAGMPGISDPGFLAARAAIKNNIDVVVIPGVSASITSLVGSGLPSKNFYFHGFLSSKQNFRRKELEELNYYKK